LNSIELQDQIIEALYLKELSLSGFEISQQIMLQRGDKWWQGPGYGTLYRALGKLTKDGQLEQIKLPGGRYVYDLA
jgi:DNA-binding PadR family transcriptional regulator